jgi:transcriptional regulator with XRE-family HTH domain
MDFGGWIKSHRKEQKLDIQVLAKRSGVEASTISRAENARTQVTLLTAIRLCEGLGVTLDDLLYTVYGQHTTKGDHVESPVATNVPTIKDVEQFLSYFHRNEEEAKVWLSNLLNKIFSMSRNVPKSVEGSPLRLFVPEDVQKLLVDSPMYRFEVQYPPALASNDILSIYRQGGMLTLIDVGEYIKRLRRERQVTLEQMEQRVKLSPSILSRLESGFTEQIKLADVLILDEQLGQEGTLLSMYWEAYRSYERIIRCHGASSEQDLKLTMLYTTACRWLQAINPSDASWMGYVHIYEKLV